MALTDIRCRTAKCDGQKIIKLGDGDGLYLWVFDTGRKVWHFRYKFNCKEKGLSFGKYPQMTLGEARLECRRLGEILYRGIDPSAAKKEARRASVTDAVNSFEAVARDWYSKQVRGWKPKHAADVLRRLESNIFPHIGDRPIGKITGPELLRAMEVIEQRGATDLAHRVNGVCGQVFRYGIAKGLCAYDLSASIVQALTPHIKKNQPAVQPREIPSLMLAIGQYHLVGDIATQLGLLVLAHTFTRTTELIQAKKTEFIFEENIWEIPAARMKKKNPHLVPLTPQVVGYLKRLIELSGDSEYILPGRNALTHMSNNTLLYALYRMGYKSKMTGHGFRAMASTVLNESGFNPDWVEKQLAHEEENKVRGAYNRAKYLKGRRMMMQWWSDYLDAMERGGSPPDIPQAAAAS